MEMPWRTVPFGYCIRDGKVAVEEGEATYDLAKQAMSGTMPGEGYTAKFTAITKDNVSQFLK